MAAGRRCCWCSARWRRRARGCSRRAGSGGRRCGPPRSAASACSRRSSCSCCAPRASADAAGRASAGAASRPRRARQARLRLPSRTAAASPCRRRRRRARLGRSGCVDGRTQYLPSGRPLGTRAGARRRADRVGPRFDPATRRYTSTRYMLGAQAMARRASCAATAPTGVRDRPSRDLPPRPAPGRDPRLLPPLPNEKLRLYLSKRRLDRRRAAR